MDDQHVLLALVCHKTRLSQSQPGVMILSMVEGCRWPSSRQAHVFSDGVHSPPKSCLNLAASMLTPIAANTMAKVILMIVEN